jgi:hypothetical protein
LVPEGSVKKVLLLATLTLALTAGSGPAQAADECDGLMVCVPVAGPWVVVPVSSSVPRPRVEYQLTCPRGHIVGGIDAELSNRSIDITFIGKLGSPVNPGITTSRSVVFVAQYVGSTAAVATFRPHIGCMPASGGGGIPTAAAAAAVVPPGDPTIRRVRLARVRPGRQTIARGCGARELLVDAAHGIGFATRRPPSATAVGLVTARHAVRGSRVVATVEGNAELGTIRAVVQVQAVCSRVR